MTPYYDEGGITIYHGDCREVMPALDPVTACVTDPPYGLGFMGQGWDRQVPGVEFWRLVRGALLPGAACLTFGGTRTYHRLACAIEDAGFEIRDCLMWLYGQGFPKSLDIAKALDRAAGAERETVGSKIGKPGYHLNGHDGNGIYGDGIGSSTPEARAKAAEISVASTEAARTWEGWGTALKPAYEPILLAMNPLDGTFAENAIKHGVAGLNVEGCRVGTEKHRIYEVSHIGGFIVGTGSKHVGKGTYHAVGRWPANIVHDGSDEVEGMFPPAGGGDQRASGTGRRPGGFAGVGSEEGSGGPNAPVYDDSGSAARFFYSPKACGTDRGNRPEYDMPLFDEVEPAVRNAHPTVKPTSVLHWLLTLISTPTGGVVLDPFMGSGTTLCVAKDLGVKAIGIEIEEKYCGLAVKRLTQGVPGLHADMEDGQENAGPR